MDTTILQIADVHFGSEHPKALRAVEAFLEETGPDLVIVAGDLTQRGAKDEFSAARSWLEGLGVPVLAVPGNHDTPMLDLLHRVAFPFDRYNENIGHLSDPVCQDGLFVAGLNTARGWQVRSNWAEGSVRLDDLDALIKQAIAARGDMSVLVCHHPFVAPRDVPLRVATRRGRRAHRRLSQSPFHLLLTGHVHVPRVVQHTCGSGQYLSVTAGTLSTRTRGEPQSFNEICIRDGTVRVRVHEATNGAAALRDEHRVELAALYDDGRDHAAE